MDKSNKELCNVIEAALFSAETPLSPKQLQFLFPKSNRPSNDVIMDGIHKLIDEYKNRGVE